MSKITIGSSLILLKMDPDSVDPIKVPCTLEGIEIKPNESNLPKLSITLHVVDQDGKKYSNHPAWFEVPYPS